MLIILSGLPGVGKTTIARQLARDLPAVLVRIDSIEQGIRSSGLLTGSLDDAGYRAGYGVAADNLRLGLTVVADSVNPLRVTRAAWRNVARHAGTRSLDVEIVCTDGVEHRRRVEGRAPDLAGHRLPTWDEVIARDYEPWDADRIVIDTAAIGVEQAAATISSHLDRTRATPGSF